MNERDSIDYILRVSGCPIEARIFKEVECEVFGPGDTFLFRINNFLTMNDIRLQIKKLKLEGYYFLFNGLKLPINNIGRLSNWPPGFYDRLDKQLDEFIDI